MLATEFQNQVLFLKEEDSQIKKTYAKKVYHLLEEGYKNCGGINIGSGFKNKKEMCEKIPFWRLTFINGKLTSAMMFKDKGKGLKMIAYSSLKNINENIKSQDLDFMLNNSYAELSGALLVIALKYLGEKWHKYIVNANKILNINEIIKLKKNHSKNIIPENSIQIFERVKREWPELLNDCYFREIGNELKMKVIVGKV